VSYLQQLEPLDADNQQLRANVHPADWENPRAANRYNLVVIGAGTAGLVAAAGAAGLGAKVALIERGLMGGDCLNVGCVPSKALIGAARQVAAIRRGGEFGIRADLREVDFAAVMQRMRRLRAEISPHDSAKRFSELGVDVFFGEGAFTGEHSVQVAGQTLRFQAAVIATGARAAELPIPGLRETGYLTNESLFSLTRLPQRLIVIGGGPIGCEMAQCFARFGSQVTLVEQAGHILSREETDAALIVQRSLQRDGVRVMAGATVVRVELNGTDRVVVVQQHPHEQQISGDAILLAIGRTPNLEGLGLESVGVRFDPLQGVEVNDRLQTTNRHIYAAGDVCSRYKFTHAADFMARIVIQNALFLGRAKVSSLIVPWCTYTAPEIAHVGIYPLDAERDGVRLSSFTQSLSGVDRALLEGDAEGLVRVHCRRGSDQIIGATIVAPQAGDLIVPIVMAMKHRIGLGKIASVIHPYPTHADAIRKLGDQFNRTRLTPWVKSLFQQWLSWRR